MSGQLSMFRGDDLAGYDECHFFAGIGVWASAVAEAEEAAGHRLARPLFTGSCPCQPLSVAGQRQGHVDERHLWPAFHRLIAERRPATILGEQVAGKDGREWMAAVRHDLEAADMPSGPPSCQLAVSARRTSGTACSSWRTPTAGSANSLRGRGQDQRSGWRAAIR